MEGFKEYLEKIYPMYVGKDLSELRLPVDVMIKHAEDWAKKNVEHIRLSKANEVYLKTQDNYLKSFG